MRSPDQILKEAAAGISADLPGMGEKLNLGTYFRSGADHRVANKLMNDNGLLPQHLQDRKDAEEARESAEEDLRVQIDRLTTLSDQIAENGVLLARFLDGEPDLLKLLPFGPALDAKEATGKPDHREAEGALDQMIDRVRLFDRKRTDTLARYRETLLRANQATDRCNKHVVSTGPLMPPYPTARAANIEKYLAEAESRLPASVVLPDPAVGQLRHRIRGSRSVFRRFVALFTYGTAKAARSSKPQNGLELDP